MHPTYRRQETAQGGEEWAHLGSNQGKVSANPRTFDGFPLAFAVIALTAAIIPFGYWAALGLLVLLVLPPAVDRRKQAVTQDDEDAHPAEGTP